MHPSAEQRSFEAGVVPTTAIVWQEPCAQYPATPPPATKHPFDIQEEFEAGVVPTTTIVWQEP